MLGESGGMKKSERERRSAETGGGFWRNNPEVQMSEKEGRSG